jgi:hypothetical protein
MGPPQGAVPAIGSDSFAALLEQARAGNVESGVPLRVPSQLGLNLNQSQVERLMKAADQAEAQGAARALVMMDGMGITLDVGTRTVTGTVDASKPGVLEGIDAVVVAGVDPNSPEGKAHAGGVLAMPSNSQAFQPQLTKLFERGSADSTAA